MPYDSNGNASLVPGYLAVEGQTILPSQHNPPLEDIASMLSQVVLRSGVAPMTGALNMNGFKVTGLGTGSASGDAVTYAQLQEVISLISNATPTGAVKGFRRTTAPTGWVKENGGTIGSASSGATTRANADTEALFTLLWTDFSNTILPIQDSSGVATTRGGSAAADFAANKRMPLFDSRSRFHRGADDGLGFDATLTVGATQADGIKNHTHPGDTTPTTVTLTGIQNIGDAQTGGAGARLITGGTLSSITIPAIPFTSGNNTGGLALETRPRSSVVLICIKL